MLRKNQSFLSKLYMIFDVLIIALAFGMAWWIKFISGWLENDSALPYSTYVTWGGIYAVIVLLVGAMSSLYHFHRKKRFADQLLRIFQTHAISLFILLGLLFFFKQVHISREFLAIFITAATIGTVIYRYTVKVMLRSLRQKGYNKQFIVILGAGSLGKRFYENLRNHPDMGYEVIGFLDDQAEWDALEKKRYKPILGTLNDLDQLLNDKLVDEVIIALPLDAHHKFPDIIAACEKAGVRTLIIPDFFDYLPARPYFDNFAGMPMINVRDIPLDVLRNRVFKRGFDIVFSLVAILITSPVMLLIALGIKVTSPGPILFKQERVGLNRRTFHMYKFRSMKVSADVVSDTVWTTENDPRKTKFGSFLRKTSLDELPQFFNVLLGHMSVVGPRPERPFFVEQFKEEIPKYMVKHHVRPGITGWAQSNGLRGDTSIEERIRYDIFYIENWSLLFDIKIIWKTIWNGFVNKNAY
ncbi:undecaprenyl-phosphate glucose phosphotransferase [Paenibacillus melissococcoides]|uniref:Undecaprenyl-phosphate glucose phosphotransferase n=1 Tax=Paenibacillus melissococcoides TaxID=2912268 RepID=A0ABN8UCV1_9BACL|nr:MULTISPECIES: undecaprenyl-phosphate glucose phosphotransferase [Paenibacillus]MEB9895335.1 undecaprenyl-phosphate glucose phosphotransferase [Bacillus cereus]CAH8248966.1 undecaprenyl-phosphate glucose phosphotransferase [Paenibacillus melissococcoides]CAH8720740.1 undecaprenyl-phosphate glucose phosphotransferase [Paenibacillus melissococcoides]CAH8720910.1 undecaprenyl-phosphate glucose phosphotransferase [Paenibacillus melissococcoides]GIO81634.1 undecaprenyl-phosphate glucose phosphotr